MPTNAKKIKIGGVSHDLEDTYARTELSALKSNINTVVCPNLMGEESNVLYPVIIQPGATFTVSTSDGSVFPTSSTLQVLLLDQNGVQTDYFSLKNGETYRTITTNSSRPVTYYLKWNETPSIPLMVVYGNIAGDYVPYFSPLNDQIDDVRTALGQLGEIKKYNNIATPIFTPLTVNTANGAVTISNVVNVEAGKTYFGYALIDITNLVGYTSGYMYLRAWNSLVFTLTGKMAGNNDQPISNGELELYGEFTPSTSGTVKMMLYHENSANAYSYNVTVKKLYLIEGTTDELKAIRSNEYNNELIVAELYDDNVGLKKLTPEVRSIIGAEESFIIDCWGDSLTAGSGGDGTTYPAKLQELIGETYTVNNYGQASENAEAIAFRQGGINGIVDPFTASTDYVTVPALKSIDGASLGSLNLQGTYYGNNTVSIDGINYFYRRVSATECKLARMSGSSNPTYTRPMIVTAEGKGTGHIIIICAGQNGWANEDSITLANVIQRMIEHNGYDKYLVLGIPTGNYNSKNDQEAILGAYFGNHFVNTREYISAYGIADNPTVTPDSTDEQEMADGAIPHSLRSDTVHLNGYGYIAMANCVFARGRSLGYWGT